MSKACGRWNVSRISREEGRRDQKQLSDRVQQTCFPSKWPLKHRWRKWRPPLSILIILSLMEEGAFRFSPRGNNQSNYGIPHCIGVWSDCWPGVMSFCREAVSASLSADWSRLFRVLGAAYRDQVCLWERMGKPSQVLYSWNLRTNYHDYCQSYNK